MSTFEDDISRVMAGHDGEAPRAADLLRALEQASPLRRRPGWYVPVMVAASVAAVVAGSVWAYQDIGRLGQDTAMVPAGSTSVTICAPNARTVTTSYQALVSALNRLPTRPSTHSCSATPGPSAAYQIFFSYSEGPPVLVSILIGCHPAIDSDDLQASSASSVMPVVRQLLKPA